MYAWMYGPDSFMSRRAGPLSWADLGETDAVATARRIVEGFKQLRNISQ